MAPTTFLTSKSIEIAISLRSLIASILCLSQGFTTTSAHGCNRLRTKAGEAAQICGALLLIRLPLDFQIGDLQEMVQQSSALWSSGWSLLPYRSQILPGKGVSGTDALMMKIFLCYASDDREIAEHVQLALLGAGWDVFLTEHTFPLAAITMPVSGKWYTAATSFFS